MAIRKYGRGEIIPESDDNQKVASKEWDAKDEDELRVENEDTDGD